MAMWVVAALLPAIQAQHQALHSQASRPQQRHWIPHDSDVRVGAIKQGRAEQGWPTRRCQVPNIALASAPPHLAQQAVQLPAAEADLGQAAVGWDAQHRLLQLCS